jgi:hypothetical protein
LPDQLLLLLAVLPDVEGERAGPLDLLVVPAHILAVAAQHVELAGDLRAGAQASAYVL